MWVVAGGDKIVWLSGAQTARIPKNSRAGKQGGRLPVLLGENRRELGEIEAFWNERRPLAGFQSAHGAPDRFQAAASYTMQQLRPKLGQPRGVDIREKAHPPTPMGTVAHAHTVSVLVGHAWDAYVCTCVRWRLVHASGGLARSPPRSRTSRGRRTRCAFSVLG